MAKQLFSVLATLALASTLIAGCGVSPNGATTGIKSATTAETVQAKDYYTVSRAKRVAQDGLARYNSLRNDWLRAYSDREKDRIEDQMLVVLSQTIVDWWYTGVYTVAGKPRLATHTGALMWSAMELPAPGTCAATFGAWSKPPRSIA